MKSKVIISVILGVAVIFLAYICIMSVVTPIKFEEQRTYREVAVIKNLVNLRAAEAEFKLVNGRYTSDYDSLIMFLKNTPKKEVLKEGALTDKQLENGLTEHKATKIIERAKMKAQAKTGIENDSILYEYIWENDPEIIENQLSGFRRDTIYKNMIETLYKGEYTAENIESITFIPFSNNLRFELEVNNEYTTSQGIHVPLFEARAPYETYMSDQNKQELVNLIDKEVKLEHYPGLKVGDIYQPNNNAGNWE